VSFGFIFRNKFPNSRETFVMINTREQLIKTIAQAKPQTVNKVTIVGCGAVGCAIAFSVLQKGITKDILLIDNDEDKLQGELMDFQHASTFLRSPKIAASSNYAASASSRLIIVTAGVRKRGDESTLDLVQRNTDIFKKMIPKLSLFSPDAILMIVTKPCDILTYVAWKLSGFPKHRVIGAGTNLETSRFRFLLSQRFGVATTSIHGWIIGELDGNSIPVWSGVNLAGVRLRDINPQAALEDDTEDWEQCFKEVISASQEVIHLKGYTSWAVAMSCADLAAAILDNAGEVKAVSTMVKGLYGIDKEVFLSVPCVVDSNGVSSTINMPLSREDSKKLRHSANLMDEIQKSIIF